MTATADYWQTRYADESVLARKQLRDAQHARVFLTHIKQARERAPGNPGVLLNRALMSAHSYLEIACGTGELASLIQKGYCHTVTYVTDPAAEIAAIAQRQTPQVRFERFDILTDWPTHLGNFSLAVAFDVLQHFPDPVLVTSRLLTLADQAIVVVPRSRFTSKKTFSVFRIRDDLTYRWENRTMMALLLEKKRPWARRA